MRSGIRIHAKEKRRHALLIRAGVCALAGAWFMYSTSALSCSSTTKAAKTMLELRATDNNRTVTLGPGETVRVTLAENASTGYHWTVDRYDEALFTMLPPQSSYDAAAVGSGGEVAFIFQAKKTGTGEIMLKQWRSWEGDSSISARFHITLQVNPQRRVP